MNEDAFLAAIVAEPNDDTHRLVFADWLDDHGQPDRAEFIRTQIELSTYDILPPTYDDFASEGVSPSLCLRERTTRRFELERREAELLGANRRKWWPQPRGGFWPYFAAFRRGFVEGLSLPLERFLELGEQLLSLAPIRHVDLHLQTVEELDRLLACPFLDRLTALNLSASQYDGFTAHVRRLAECRHLRNLELLALSWFELGDGEFSQLLDTPNLTRLKFLGIREGSIGAEGVEALVRSPMARQLEGVGLRRQQIDAEATTVLANSEGLANLRVLDLTANPIGNAGAVALAASPYLNRLQVLRMPTCELSSSGVSTLANSPNVQHLTALCLAHNRIVGAVPSVAASPHLDNLRYLDLTDTNLGDREANLLAHSSSLSRLQVLFLAESRITDHTVAGWRTGFPFEHLERFVLDSDRIQQELPADWPK